MPDNRDSYYLKQEAHDREVRNNRDSRFWRWCDDYDEFYSPCKSPDLQDTANWIVINKVGRIIFLCNTHYTEHMRKLRRIGISIGTVEFKNMAELKARFFSRGLIEKP